MVNALLILIFFFVWIGYFVSMELKWLWSKNSTDFILCWIKINYWIKFRFFWSCGIKKKKVLKFFKWLWWLISVYWINVTTFWVLTQNLVVVTNLFVDRIYSLWEIWDSIKNLDKINILYFYIIYIYALAYWRWHISIGIFSLAY